MLEEQETLPSAKVIAPQHLNSIDIIFEDYIEGDFHI